MKVQGGGHGIEIKGGFEINRLLSGARDRNEYRGIQPDFKHPISLGACVEFGTCIRLKGQSRDARSAVIEFGLVPKAASVGAFENALLRSCKQPLGVGRINGDGEDEKIKPCILDWPRSGGKRG